MGKLKQGNAAKTFFASYESKNRALANKTAKLARHVKLNPNDAQAASAKASGHTRKAPVTNTMGVKVPTGFVIVGTKEIVTRAGRKIIVPDVRMAQAKKAAANGRVSNAILKGKVDFSIRARAIFKGGCDAVLLG